MRHRLLPRPWLVCPCAPFEEEDIGKRIRNVRMWYVVGYGASEIQERRFSRILHNELSKRQSQMRLQI